MRKKIVLINFLIITLYGCSNNINEIRYIPAQIIATEEVSCVENENTVYYQNNENIYYTNCIDSLEVSYQNIKLIEELKDALNLEHVTIDEIINLSNDKEVLSLGTKYNYKNFNFYLCSNKNNFFRVDDINIDDICK